MVIKAFSDEAKLLYEQIKTELKEWKKPFVIIMGIYLVGIWAIIRANFNYIDDMGRVFDGHKRWDTFSRYLSDFLSNIIHADSYLTDVSPLPQIMAAAIMALAAIALLYCFWDNKNISFWQYTAIVPLGLSPYFLECFSYKYDAPYMALSVLASVVPLLFRKRHFMLFGTASFLGMIIVCTTYQAASGIFPMLIIVMTLRDWTKGKDRKMIFTYWITAIVSYISGLGIFRLFIMKPAETYVSNSVNPSQMIDHWKQYIVLVRSDFKKEWLILTLILIIAFIIAMVKGSSVNKPVVMILSVGAAAAMWIAAFGVYPLLSTPLYAPRAMYSVGVLISLLMIEIFSEKKIYWGKASAVLLAWCFFVFSFTYGNALYVQKQYTDYRITMVAEDLNELYNDSSVKKKIQISGTIGFAPAIRNMPDDYNMLNRLIPVTFRGDWHWGSFGLIHYYDLKKLKVNKKNNYEKLDLPVLKTTALYTIKGDEKHILLELKE